MNSSDAPLAARPADEKAAMRVQREKVPVNSAIVAVLTCFNRREKTLSSLRAFEAASIAIGSRPAAVLVDDGSTDGTAEAVRRQFDWVDVQQSAQVLFWNRGMHQAMSHALRAAPASAQLLWLNDDTDLNPDALQRLLETAAWVRRQHGRAGIVVGATCDAVTGRLSYGGIVAPNPRRPFQFAKVHSAEAPVACQAMNGNVVLIPREVLDDVGLLDPAFEHAMGDIDYGLRAGRRGHPIYVAPGFVGRCSNNPKAGTYEDDSLPLRRRMRLMLHRKGLPWRSWLVFTRRHGGLLWPAYFAWPYLRVALRGLLRRSAPPAP